MGSLIQTKGTRLLAQFFANQFGPGPTTSVASAVNLNWLRLAAKTGGGGGAPLLPDLLKDFQLQPSLLHLSEKYRNSGPFNMALFYPFSSIQTNAATAAGSPTLNFAANAIQPWVMYGAAFPNGAYVVDDEHPGVIATNTFATAAVTGGGANTVTMSANARGSGVAMNDNISFITFPIAALPTTGQQMGTPAQLNFSLVPTGLIKAGMGVIDYTTLAAIPINTTVNAVTPTSVTLAPAPAAGAIMAGDSIGFLSNGNHQNLMRRWKYFLRNELHHDCDSQIRAALLRSLLDANIQFVDFDVIEGTSQIVHTSVEYIAATDFSTLSGQYMHIVLETPATKAGSDPVAPIQIDNQIGASN